jgi:quinol-cytochrome oxidoreductase complex cytochrome b subunit
MNKHSNKTWIIITVIFCVVFVILFYPIAAERVGHPKAIVYTLIGLLVIWLIYFIRAYVFSKIFSKKNNTNRT